MFGGSVESFILHVPGIHPRDLCIGFEPSAKVSFVSLSLNDWCHFRDRVWCVSGRAESRGWGKQNPLNNAAWPSWFAAPLCSPLTRSSYCYTFTLAITTLCHYFVHFFFCRFFVFHVGVGTISSFWWYNKNLFFFVDSFFLRSARSRKSCW